MYDIYIILNAKWTGRDLNPKPSPCKGDVIPGLTTSPQYKDSLELIIMKNARECIKKWWHTMYCCVTQKFL